MCPAEETNLEATTTQATMMNVVMVERRHLWRGGAGAHEVICSLLPLALNAVLAA